LISSAQGLVISVDVVAGFLKLDKRFLAYFLVLVYILLSALYVLREVDDADDILST